MKRFKGLNRYLLIALFLGFMAPILAGPTVATGHGLEERADRKALQEGLQESLGMPVLTGEIWVQMTQYSKMSFLWGIGHVVSIEQHLMETFPELKRESYVAKVIEGLADISIEKIISKVDEFYDTNQNQLETPVTNVIWDLVIKPNIKTGIAGHQR